MPAASAHFESMSHEELATRQLVTYFIIMLSVHRIEAIATGKSFKLPNPPPYT